MLAEQQGTDHPGHLERRERMVTSAEEHDKFGFLPEGGWCHRGECCGPGSWCCQRAGLHYHDDVRPPQWVGHPPKVVNEETTP